MTHLEYLEYFRKRKILKKHQKNLDLKRNFYLRKYSAFLSLSGRRLLKKVFVISKWVNGFISNSFSFFRFVKNIIKEKVKIGQVLEKSLNEIEDIIDHYPLFPSYAVIGDHRQNYWIVNEFNRTKIPNSSVVDNFTTKALFSMYGIPGNACSIDTSTFSLYC